MVVVPVAAVHYSRPYSRGALILQTIAPLREIGGSGHARLGPVRPIIEYANTIWGPHFLLAKRRLERVHHRAITEELEGI